ncbi:NADP-dependent oxidoreductase [Candidatus Nitrosocosmicus hydrocola]|uniref:NADP-dependent oxidoreductase n=1 Tax=Candidatus Nitrosocosmicus hydrocola TaxID=1826872 RepID=UPI000AB5227D|nr:NADP-dependent oxidoreductase [Candidatus Nitrosocosmicus hydrocola]
MTNKPKISKEIHLKNRPSGYVDVKDFKIVVVDVPELKEEGEFLVRNIWMSIDPFLRIYMVKGKNRALSPFELDRVIDGGCIGQIVESKSQKFKVGEYVKANFGWREYWRSKENDVEKDAISKIDSSIAPLQNFLGMLGITGLTAYVGLFKIGNLRENQETIFVSSAAGGVGSIVCQLAKIKGCQVIGSCGSDEKARYLLEEIGIDHGINYKKLAVGNISSELSRVCPNGIDIYFDNVGGEHLEAAIDNMNIFGRIVLCGTTSQYNDVAQSTSSVEPDRHIQKSFHHGPSNLSLAVSNRLRLQGFIWSDHYDILDEFNLKMSKWISDGKVKLKESIFEGLESAPNAFVNLFNGQIMDRALVRISPE